MAFDAKEHVGDILTALADELKQARARQVEDEKLNASIIARIEDEIAGWQALLSDAKPVAKKAAAKK